jgi:deoxyribonuclease IV
MRFGGHVSIAGGLERAVERATAITADCIQIFVAAPQQWREAKHSDESIAKLATACTLFNIRPILLHAQYLINLASPEAFLRNRSADALVSQLTWADRLGAIGVCFHVGSSTTDPFEIGMNHAAESLADILERAPGNAPLLLETTAGAGKTVGSRFENLGELIRRVDRSPRLQVCLDTCHIFAAGYPCVTTEELDQTLAEFDRAIGLDRLTALHLNDSKDPFGSHRDRHENIGDGQIGLPGFRAVVNHPLLAGLPAFLEVPGYDGEGPDAENLQRLRNLVTTH